MNTYVEKREPTSNAALFLLVLFNATDLITTLAFLANGGKEGNPLAAYIIAAFGIGGLILYKVLGTAFATWLLRLEGGKAATYVALIAALVFAVVSLNNFLGFLSLLH